MILEGLFGFALASYGLKKVLEIKKDLDEQGVMPAVKTAKTTSARVLPAAEAIYAVAKAGFQAARKGAVKNEPERPPRP